MLLVGGQLAEAFRSTNNKHCKTGEKHNFSYSVVKRQKHAPRFYPRRLASLPIWFRTTACERGGSMQGPWAKGSYGFYSKAMGGL